VELVGAWYMVSVSKKKLRKVVSFNSYIPKTVVPGLVEGLQQVKEGGMELGTFSNIAIYSVVFNATYYL
jgi:hypothetical protein